MFGLLPSKAKKKRAHDDHPHLKRTKIDNNNNGLSVASKNSIQFETTLSPPIQAALCKFREASEQELTRLRKEGMDPSTAINKLVQKMRTESDVQPRFTRQELELVMEMAGVNEEGATRALILRSELAKLRHDGFNHPEAINELSRRMKRLAGSKRRGSSSMEKLIEGKHRRKEKDNNTHTNTTTTTTTTTPNTSTTYNTPSRVSFTSFDPLEGLELVSLPSGGRFLPISASSTLTPSQTSSTPLSSFSINRKRLQDALMLDGEQYELLRKRQKYDFSDSENEGDNASDSEEGGQYAFIDEGDFSHDDDDDDDDEERLDEDGSEGDISLRSSAFTHNYSSSEGEDIDRGMDDGEGWQNHLLFNEIKEEESDSEDHAWRLAPPSITSPISPSLSSSSSTTTTTTTTTTTSSSSLSPSPSFSSFFPSATPSPPTPPTRLPTTKTSKRRDGTSSSSSSSSSSFISNRTTKS